MELNVKIIIIIVIIGRKITGERCNIIDTEECSTCKLSVRLDNEKNYFGEPSLSYQEKMV